MVAAETKIWPILRHKHKEVQLAVVPTDGSCGDIRIQFRDIGRTGWNTTFPCKKPTKFKEAIQTCEVQYQHMLREGWIAC